MLPPAGSYVAVARVRGDALPAAAFVPTGTHDGLVEAFLPDWEGEIYGEIAAIEFVSFIRQPEMDATESELRRLISDDVEHVMEVAREWR
jgi:FAD synthase